MLHTINDKTKLYIYGGIYMLSLINNDFFDRMDKSFDNLMKRNSFPAIILRNMRTDIASTDEAYTITMDVPGFKKEDIKISIDELILTVVAEKHEETESTDKEVITCERCDGRCERHVRLSDDADVDKITAKVEDGVLIITIPRKERPEKDIKTIDIQ